MKLVKDKKTKTRISSGNLPKEYEDQHPQVTKEKLQELYIDKKLSSRKVGEILGCGSDLILKRLRQHGLPVRKRVGDPSFTEEERREKWGRNGTDHPRWKGGITTISGMIRNRLAHVSLERFKIDGFSCVECGGGEHHLNAHHIRPFSEIVAEIRKENDLEDLTSWDNKVKLADICEQDERLLDIENLVTLCEDCHREIHYEAS